MLVQIGIIHSNLFHKAFFVESEQLTCFQQTSRAHIIDTDLVF